MWNTLFDEKMALRMSNEKMTAIQQTLHTQYLADQLQCQQPPRTERLAQFAGWLASKLRLETAVIQPEPEFEG